MGRVCFLRFKEEPIIDSLASGFARLENEVTTIVVDPAQKTSEQVQSEIESFSPDVCFTHNYYVFSAYFPSRNLERFLESKQIPTLVWFWDSPIATGHTQATADYLFGTLPSNILNICADSAHDRFLKSRKIRSEFVPIGVADEFLPQIHSIQPQLSSRFTFDLSFVGSPMQLPLASQLKGQNEVRSTYLSAMLAELMTGVPHGDRQRYEQIVQLFKSALDIFFDRDYFRCEEYEKARNAFIETIHKSLGTTVAKNLLTFLGRLDFAYSWYQLNSYLYRLSEFKPAVFGGDAWNKFIPGYSEPCPRLSQEELLALFKFSRISFCHTKWHFRNVVHERVFLAYACGGFPLTDFKEDLAHLFERDEIVAYEGIEHAKDLIRFYLKNETARRSIAEKGRKKVLAKHLYSHRARELSKVLNQHFGLKLKS